MNPQRRSRAVTASITRTLSCAASRNDSLRECAPGRTSASPMNEPAAPAMQMQDNSTQPCATTKSNRRPAAAFRKSSRSAGRYRGQLDVYAGGTDDSTIFGNASGSLRILPGTRTEMLGFSPATPVAVGSNVNNFLAARHIMQTNEASILLIGERFWR